jgi:tetratricopeptide (TPR) repeat protein
VHYVEIRKRLLPSKADPKDVGAAYAKQGEWQRAVEIWERCAAASPGDGALWHDIGVSYEALGKVEQAEAAYNKALGIDPANRLYIEDIAQIRNAFRGAPPSAAQGTATATDVAVKLADTTPKIIKIEPTGEVYISVGSKAGVKLGDKFTVYGEKEIKSPDTGEVLGVDTFDKAELVIVKVMDNISLCKATKTIPGNKLAVKDKVKPIK